MSLIVGSTANVGGGGVLLGFVDTPSGVRAIVAWRWDRVRTMPIEELTILRVDSDWPASNLPDGWAFWEGRG